MNHTTLRAAALAATLLITGTASQAEVFSLQGSVSAITRLANGNVELTCGLVKTVVTAASAVSTPAGRLSLAQLADPTPFTASGYNPRSGALRAGFVGTTCSVDGNDTDVPGQLTASIVSMEVEENLLLGAKRGAATAGLDILGVPVVASTDARLSALRLAAGLFNANGTHPGTLAPGNGNTESVRLDLGFGVNPATVPTGDLIAASGYYGVDGRFYAYAIDTSTGTLLRTEPRPSIQRAACINDTTRARDSIDARGGCVLPAGTATTTVTIEGLLANGSYQTYGTATCTAQGLAPAGANYDVGRWTFGLDRFALTNDVCPSSVRVRTTTGAVTRYDFLTPDVR